MGPPLVVADSIFVQVFPYQVFMHPCRCVMHDSEVGGFARHVLRSPDTAYVVVVRGAADSAANCYWQAEEIADRFQNGQQFGVHRIATATAGAGELGSNEMWG